MGLIFISHDLRLVSTFCDRILVMYAGKRRRRDRRPARWPTPRTPTPAGLLNCLPRLGDDRHPLPTLDRAGVGAVTAPPQVRHPDTGHGRSSAWRAEPARRLRRLRGRRDTLAAPCEAGESFGIVGESGSGKSTVLRAICGLAPRRRQVATAAGRQPRREAPGSKAFRRLVQMVFQDPYGAAPAPDGRPHPGRAAGHPRHRPTPRTASSARWTRSAWARLSASATRTSSRAASASVSRLRAR
jgi:ABC-type glutathione transport system ATPase component